MSKGMSLSVAGAVVALGLVAGEARASFLVQVTATLNAPGGGSMTVGASNATIAALAPTPTDLNVGAVASTSPLHVTYGTTTTSSADASGVDPIKLPYTWLFTISHVVNGKVQGDSTSFGISGIIGGGLAMNGSTLNNTYTVGSTSAIVGLEVDGRDIFVKLDPWTPPGSGQGTTRDFSLAILADSAVGFSGGGGGGGGVVVGPQTVPEPTTLALLGVGGMLLAAPYLRRKARPST